MDEETWERVQAIKKQRMSRSKRNTRVSYMLQHLVRCSGCGMLLGGRATRQNTVRRNGKAYHYDLEPPRRYYQCYGMQRKLTRCRKHPFIRAERLEDMVWNEVTKVVQDPEVIVTGMDTLRVGQDSNLEEEIAQAERDLRAVQLEEDRAIRLYVSEKITEAQLDRQRQVITERLEHFRVRLENRRAHKAVATHNHVLAGHIEDWARTVDQNLEGLGTDERKDVLKFLLDSVMNRR